MVSERKHKQNGPVGEGDTRREISVERLDRLAEEFGTRNALRYIEIHNNELRDNLRALIIDLRVILEALMSNSTISTNWLFKTYQHARTIRETLAGVTDINTRILEKIEQVSLLEIINKEQVFELYEELLNWLQQIASDQIKIGYHVVQELRRSGNHPKPSEPKAREDFLQAVFNKVKLNPPQGYTAFKLDAALGFYLVHISLVSEDSSTELSRVNIPLDHINTLINYLDGINSKSEEVWNYQAYARKFHEVLSLDESTIKATIKTLLDLVDVRIREGRPLPARRKRKMRGSTTGLF